MCVTTCLTFILFFILQTQIKDITKGRMDYDSRIRAHPATIKWQDLYIQEDYQIGRPHTCIRARDKLVKKPSPTLHMNYLLLSLTYS